MISLVFALLITALPAQEKAFVSTEHMKSRATIMLIDGKTTLRLEAPNAAARLVPLSGDWKHVSMLRFSSDASRLAMVGLAAPTPQAAVMPQAAIIDVSTGRAIATYPIGAAAVSPDARALIIEHGGKGQSAGAVRFSLIPLNAPENLLAPSSTALDVQLESPAARVSDFVWVDPEVVTFISAGAAGPGVVALQVDSSGKVQKRAEKPLPAATFADAAILKDRAALSKALTDVEITRIPSSGLTLRVNLAPGPVVKTRATELQMW